MEAFYRTPVPTAEVDRETRARPDGSPAPTGYFPNRSWPQQGVASFSPTNDDLAGCSPASGGRGLYGPDRVEALDDVERVDQHPWLQVSATWTPMPDTERPSGHDDPLADGPPQPTLRMLQLFYARAQGTMSTRFLDVPGRKFPPNGSQDGSSWAYYQDPARAMAAYDPAPGQDEMPDSLRALPPSPAHGWTEQPAYNAKERENTKSLRDLKQQAKPHQDRLAPSTYAGQSYSASTAHAGATQVPGQVPTRRPRG